MALRVHEPGRKLVLASTSDVYGRNPALPFSEENTDHVIGNSKSPRWAYAVSKLFDEHLALAFFKLRLGATLTPRETAEARKDAELRGNGLGVVRCQPSGG